MQNKYIALARLSIITSAIALVALLCLHFVSPEFSPSWRMISEYARGKHEWILSVFFFCGGLSEWFAVISLWSLIRNPWGKIGLVLLFISGIGGVMASFFNVDHPLHGTAALLGVPSFLLAALLISFNLRKRYPINQGRLKWATNFTWISLLLMVIAMVVMISGLKKAGLFHPESHEAPKSIPDSVIALAGYTNRLLILANSYWLILVDLECIKIYKNKNQIGE